MKMNKTRIKSRKIRYNNNQIHHRQHKKRTKKHRIAIVECAKPHHEK